MKTHCGLKLVLGCDQQSYNYLCQLMLLDLLEQKTPNTYKKYQNTYKNVILYFLLEERNKKPIE